MTALKGREIERFAAKPDLASGLVVVYGPDTGLVSETAAALCRHWAGDPPDPMVLITLQMSEIDADPQRLGVEARTPSLFGGTRVVRLRNATAKLAKTLTDLFAEGFEAMIVVEAGNLTPADALRKLAEQRRDARALPCYADSDDAIDALVRRAFTEAGIAFDRDVVPLLRDMLGNDRQITRREVEKLVLYAQESQTLSAEDVLALCGDNAALVLDHVVDAVGTGHARKFDDAMNRAQSAGTDPQRLLAVALQHFQRLRALRTRIEEGSGAEEAIRNAQPRIHFSRKSAIEQQLRLWSDEALGAACARLLAATAESRKHGVIAAATARQALLAICLAAARR